MSPSRSYVAGFSTCRKSRLAPLASLPIRAARPSAPGHIQTVRANSGSSTPAGNPEAIGVAGRTKAAAGGRLLRRQRGASRIGDPVDGVEQADDTGRVDQPRRTSAVISKTRAARLDTRNIYMVNSYLAIAISIIT
jgi:hypothetical protein